MHDRSIQHSFSLHIKTKTEITGLIHPRSELTLGQFPSLAESERSEVLQEMLLKPRQSGRGDLEILRFNFTDQQKRALSNSRVPSVSEQRARDQQTPSNLINPLLKASKRPTDSLTSYILSRKPSRDQQSHLTSYIRSRKPSIDGQSSSNPI